MRLIEQKAGRWNEEDRLELSRLLIKGGYQVAIRKEKPEGKKQGVTYIDVQDDMPAKEAQ